jgi:lysine decarboxylase
MVTFGDDATTATALVDALVRSVERRRGDPRPVVAGAAWSARLPAVAMPPREAFFAEHETVPWADAAGRVSAELVAPYPPGVPAIAPGELVTREVLDVLVAARDDGGRIAYAADPTLSTLQVVAQVVVEVAV